MSQKFNIKAALYSLLISGICIVCATLVLSELIKGQLFWLLTPTGSLVGIISLFASYTWLQNRAKRKNN